MLRRIWKNMRRSWRTRTARSNSSSRNVSRLSTPVWVSIGWPLSDRSRYHLCLFVLFFPDIFALTRWYVWIAVLSRCQKQLAQHLGQFNFETIGQSQTDDEMAICHSLKEFGRVLADIEEERNKIVSTVDMVAFYG